MQEEYESFMGKGTWELAPLSKDHKSVGYKSQVGISQEKGCIQSSSALQDMAGFKRLFTS